MSWSLVRELKQPGWKARQRSADEIEHAETLEKTSVPWFAGELAAWCWRAGLPAGEAGHRGPLAEPYRLEISGDATAAAHWWQDRNCAYDAALALAGSSDPVVQRRSRTEFRLLGTSPAAALVTHRLRALGERELPRGPRLTTAGNPASLTRRELDVLALLAGGQRNTEIAARLVVSGRTVDHHVSAILRTLGVRSRSAAIVEAVRLGLTDAQ